MIGFVKIGGSNATQAPINMAMACPYELYLGLSALQNDTSYFRGGIYQLNYASSEDSSFLAIRAMSFSLAVHPIGMVYKRYMHDVCPALLNFYVLATSLTTLKSWSREVSWDAPTSSGRNIEASCKGSTFAPSAV